MQATFVCPYSILTDDPAIFKDEYLGVSNLSVDGGGDNARQIELPKVRCPYKYFWIHTVVHTTALAGYLLYKTVGASLSVISRSL